MNHSHLTSGSWQGISIDIFFSSPSFVFLEEGIITKGGVFLWEESNILSVFSPEDMLIVKHK